MRTLNIFTMALAVLLAVNGNAQDTLDNMNTILQTPTNDVQQSLEFYKKLNYQDVSTADRTMVTDGKVVIEINKDPYARAGAKMFKASWDKEVEKLKELTIVHKTETGYMLNDGSGCWIYLEEGTLELAEPLAGEPSGMAGNYMGLSLEVSDTEKTYAIWQVFGFSITMGALDQGFMVLADADGFGVSMMKPMSCPHLFFNPSMTFFNGGKNLPIIESIRKAGIPITEEITLFNDEGIVDNIIIRDPGGFGFFIFND